MKEIIKVTYTQDDKNIVATELYSDGSFKKTNLKNRRLSHYILHG